MTQFLSFVQAWLATHVRDDHGATMVEYGLMVSLVAVVCILAVTALGTSISGVFNAAATAITNA